MEKEKKQKISDINWKSTWQNALSSSLNRVYKDAVVKAKKSSNGPRAPTPTTYAQCQDAERRTMAEQALQNQLQELRDGANNIQRSPNGDGEAKHCPLIPEDTN
jgi:hypothetical protein